MSSTIYQVFVLREVDAFEFSHLNEKKKKLTSPSTSKIAMYFLEFFYFRSANLNWK